MQRKKEIEGGKAETRGGRKPNTQTGRKDMEKLPWLFPPN